MNIVCPHCGAAGRANDSLAGHQVRCPKCGERFVAAREEVHFEEAAGHERPAAKPDNGRQTETVDLPAPALTVSAILKDSWKLSRDRRFALVCRVGTLLLIATMVAVSFVIDSENGLVMTLLRNLSLPEALIGFAGAMLTLISMGLGGNAEAGLPYMGIRHGAGARVGVKTCFRGFYPKCFKQVFLAGIMKTVLTVLGFLILLFPGIYLTFAYWFALPLIIDRGLAPWQALELSRQAVSKVWFQVFGAYLVMIVLPFCLPAVLFGYRVTMLLQKIDLEQAASLSLQELYGMFPGDFQILALFVLFFIALWFFLLPWFFASYGVLYQRLFTPKNNGRI